MAVGAIHLSWMRHLAKKGVFNDLHSVIDLGPQDIQLEQDILRQAMLSIAPENLDSLLGAMYSEGHIAPNAQVPFYSLFGLGPYESIDNDDPRATHRLDLNQPVRGLSEFDVVTNYGTTEHVFNIGEAFRSIHNLTRPGGISLHCVPSFAFINHGFYSVNPNVFVEMARANNYELTDFSYFDNAFVRNVTMSRTGIDGFDVSTLPIKLEDMEQSQIFMTKVVDLFLKNVYAEETRIEISNVDPATRDLPASEYPSRKHHICFVFDLIFIAMRRPTKRMPFVMPIQNANGVPPLNAPGAKPKAPAAGWFNRLKSGLRGQA